MAQPAINLKIASGLARAAAILGTSQALFRPSTATLPVSGTPYATLYCAFDVNPSFKLMSTAQPGHSYATLLADPLLVQLGDYIVGDDTHFVSRVEPLRPALCVLCNQTLDFINSSVVTSAGTNSYGGIASGADVVIAQGWPVSMLARTRGEADVTKLPSDTRAAYYDVLVPPIPGVYLTFGMQAQDPTGQNYEIVSSDYSSFGWRLLVGLVTT